MSTTYEPGDRVATVLRGGSCTTYRDGTVTESGPAGTVVKLDAGATDPARSVTFTEAMWEDDRGYIVGRLDDRGILLGEEEPGYAEGTPVGSAR